MERRARIPTPPPKTRTLAEINAAQLSLLAERKRAEELENQKLAIQAESTILVAATPPKKQPPAHDFRLETRPTNLFTVDKSKSTDLNCSETSRVESAIPSTSKLVSRGSVLPETIPTSTPPIKPSTFADGLKKVSAREKLIISEQSAPRSQGFNQTAVPINRPISRAQLNSHSKLQSIKSNPSAMSSMGPSKGTSMARHLPTPSIISEALIEDHLPLEVVDGQEGEGELDIVDGPTKPKSRHRDGTIIERIPIGPIRHAKIKNDPLFNTIEPNSGIQLKSRTLEHSALQLHLTSRYHLSPALLYSIIRPSEKGSGFLQVPLVGDFVLIGVLAQKDERRFVRGDALKGDVKEEVKTKKWNDVKSSGSHQAEGEKDELFASQTIRQKERKYIKFTFVDLSTESAASAGTGTLTLMLFESESFETINEEGKKITTYKGGSGGAYEKWWSQSVGAVVAIMNPKVMKQKIIPGIPNSNTISITPDSADSMILIGRARHLSCCQARTAAGKTCGSWCDVRVNSVCTYHLAMKVKSTAAGRSETSSSTSSHAITTSFNTATFNKSLRQGGKSNQTAFDPIKKTGLLPRDAPRLLDGAMTYVSGGNSTLIPKKSNALRSAAIQSGNGSGGYVQGHRDGPTVLEAKKARKDQKEAKLTRELEMESLLKNIQSDSSAGGIYLKLQANRKKELVKREAQELEREDHSSNLKKRKKLRKESESEESEEDREKVTKRAKPFSTTALRLIGYDPTSNGEIGREEDEEMKKKRLLSIDILSNNADRPKPNLGPPPGIKIRSGVFAPVKTSKVALEDSDDELVIEGGPS